MRILKKTLLGSPPRVPIWFMRQAGRYMPEYRAIRATEPNFLSLCYKSKKVTEITMQPIKRFDFDCAIIFSDILVLPELLGWPVEFQKGEGPVLRPFTQENKISDFETEFAGRFELVLQAINETREQLDPEKSLIGFAGCPWTLMCYLIEGRGSRDFASAKSFIFSNKRLAVELAQFLTEKICVYLSEMIRAGCDAIQLFDSWAGVLCDDEYNEFVIKPNQIIVSFLKENFPDIAVITMPKGSSFRYFDFAENVPADILSFDQFIPPLLMQSFQDRFIVQGNLDPAVLLSNKDTIARKIDDIFTAVDKRKFIFNLGHGILPNTPIENVEFAINYVRSK